MSEQIEIKTGNGPMTACMAEAKKTSNVGIVIAHDVFGIDDDIRSRVDYWSAMGYLTIAPDLFSRSDRSPLSGEDVDAAEKHSALCESFNVDRGIQDIRLAIAFARERGCHGVGVLGFGLGGLLAYLAAARTDSEASIGYCGIGVEKHLELAGSIDKPLALYFAAEDALVEKDAQQRIHEALDKHPQVRVFTHPYVRHGFARWDSKQRDRCALTLAEHRAGEFFYMNLTLKHWRTRPAQSA